MDGKGGDVSVYRFAGFRLSIRQRRLFRGEDLVSLTPKATAILIILVERHGQVVHLDEILDLVWPGVAVEPINVAVHVTGLRKIIGREAIKNIPGRGYRFTLELEPSEERAPASAKPAKFPPAGAGTNLPQLLTAMIGRQSELAELAEILAECRLVTLAGPGGIGKTRLAIELGRQVSSTFLDGVWLIDLAPLADPAAVATATAAVLGVPLHEVDDPAWSIAAAIGNRNMMLIFDNCEYRLDAAAELIAALLGRAPGLRVLVTSQEVLGCAGEQRYDLAPLAVPPPGVSEIAGFGAVDFFVERARASRRSFRLDHTNAMAVAEICRGLDGVPLALEMAAARLPSLGVHGLLARLGNRLEMFSTRPRTGEPRHRTLRATMEWSYGLLAPADRRVFRRLGIFPGSFSIDAAVAVGGADGLEPCEIECALGRLIDKSLLTVDAGDPPRYRLLETLRLFAMNKLRESNESDAIAERHGRYYFHLFDRADEAWQITESTAWVAAYRPELDNVRSVLGWALPVPERAEIAVCLLGSSLRLWDLLGFFAEGRDYADRAAPLLDEIPQSTGAARFLRAAGALWYRSNRTRALSLLERSAVLYRRHDDRPNLGLTLAAIGSLYYSFGQYDDAGMILSEAEEILADSKYLKSKCRVMDNLGYLASLRKDVVGAQRYYLRALEVATALNDPMQRCITLANIAELEFNLGSPTKAIEHGREAVERMRAVGRAANLGISLTCLASYLIWQGHRREARALAREALALVRDGGGYDVWVCLELSAFIGMVAGHCEDSAKLLGFVEARYTLSGEVRQPTELKLNDRLSKALNAAIGAGKIDACLAEGAAWSERVAVEFALGHLLGEDNRLMPEAAGPVSR